MIGQTGPNLKTEISKAGMEIDLSKYLRLILYRRCRKSGLQISGVSDDSSGSVLLLPGMHSLVRRAMQYFPGKRPTILTLLPRLP